MIKAIRDRIVVKRKVDDAVSKGGIHFPVNMERDEEALVQGEVLCVGSNEGMELSVGDDILFPRFCGVPVTLEEHGDVLVMKECDVLATLEDA